jgi:cytochrome b6-f complex iron-sulfur subunit
MNVPFSPSRRRLGGVALGGVALGLTGVLSWRYAAWSSPAREPVVFPPDDGDGIVQIGQVLLVRASGEVRAMSARCTHLGCTVSLTADGGSLICPCHGSEYDLDGGVTRGPAPRALANLDVERLDDGSCRVVPL